jgi:hypothetical protein
MSIGKYIAVLCSLCCLVSTASAVTTIGSGSTIAFNTDTQRVSIDGIYEPNGVLVNGAVEFTFNGLDLQSGSIVTVTGTKPLFIKSTGDIAVNTVINLSAPNAAQGGSPYPVGPAGPAGGWIGAPRRAPATFTPATYGPGSSWFQSNTSGGAGYGGAGGRSGRSANGVGVAYGSQELFVLLGGSGAGGGNNNGGGGGGGGAVAFQAAGALTIGTGGSILADGGNVIYPVMENMLSGGGGAGGSIRLEGGTSLTIQGTLSAKGGQGGDFTSTAAADNMKGAGGGGGGRIALYSVSRSITGTVTVAGGRKGMNPLGQSVNATDGAAGTIYQFDGMMPVTPTNPNPADAATVVSILTALSWTPNPGASAQAVYFGLTNPPTTLIASGNGTFSSVTNDQLAGPLNPSTKYYWSVRGNGQATGLVYSFTTGLGKASAPSTANGATEVSSSLATLTWTGDAASTSYDVYFSTDQAAVANRTATPTNVATASFTVPGPLARPVTYYWAVDCKAAGGITLPGDVWSFTTVTYKVTFDTDALTYSIEGGASGTGVIEPNDTVDPNLPRGAVFTFSDFTFDKTWSAAVTGSRPLIIKSTGNINIGMRIDVSAPDARTSTGTPYLTGLAGPAGGHIGAQRRLPTARTVDTDALYGPGCGLFVNAGAAGAGYGGVGGAGGRSALGGGITYNTAELFGLWGGSGGAGGNDYGSGGGGAGAVALEAAGNIVLSADAKVLANGGEVRYVDNQLPGGGGSGGSIRLLAGGSLTVAGKVSATGGQGGDISSLEEINQPKVGGGGAGGRIALYSATGSFNLTGTVTVAGGRHGTNPVGLWGTIAQDGQPGTIYKGVNFGRPAAGAAISASPLSGATGVDIHGPALSWRPYAGANPTSYDVYFGTSVTSMALLRNVAAPADPNLTGTTAPELNVVTNYFWRVDSKGSPTYGNVQGTVWMFTTRDVVCASKPVVDFNDDCRVTFADFAIFASQWKVCNLLPATDCN